MAKEKISFVCQECGYESPKWMGKCPGCSAWNTMVEELRSPASKGVSFIWKLDGKKAGATDPSHRRWRSEPRSENRSGEFNRVLGGGFVHGSLILVGGDPGIGKSTLIACKLRIRLPGNTKKRALRVRRGIPEQTDCGQIGWERRPDDLFLLAKRIWKDRGSVGDAWSRIS